ncbi:UbiA family prenyltransferase [Alloacidobacterium sp.]|uniref:UbiA family prenyltransferase n=1 Tax=Alloacidobacterium sp. TaxID=2951999 RepID=UPI002D3A6BD7|nr:UbiA family prenyltransferase [Alloacidobacterium sp.]HYK37162.1 UbiA family prenyltransferase [Alloacidobacterium sp.]
MHEQTQIHAQVSSDLMRPLCVDLDGTLVKSDTLADSVLTLLRAHPRSALGTFHSLLNGKAAFKAQVASIVSLDAAHLPYNRPLLEYLEQERGQGRHIYLTTGADARLAERIAAHLGIFDGVLASNGSTNLTGDNKLDSLRLEFNGEDFDYIGNARPDLLLLEHAGTAMLANPNASLRSLVKSRKIKVHRHFEDRSSRRKSLLKAIRLHQWAKNVLIFVPLLLAHALKLQLILDAIFGFFCFSFCASATYIVNDLLDIENDRRHATKRLRPFAAGDLQASTGIIMVIILLAAGLLGTYFLPDKFLAWLSLYIVVTLSYSLALKKVALVDVIVLSGLYTVRILAGGAATATPISTWLAGFSVFLFFSLALVKRFSEMQNLRERGHVPSNGRGYLVADIEQLRSFGTASGYAAIVVFSLYISGSNVAKLYHHPVRMWLIVPFMLLWISRVWLLASRGEMHEDPVIFAVTDRMSLLIGLAVVAIAIFAAF